MKLASHFLGSKTLQQLTPSYSNCLNKEISSLSTGTDNMTIPTSISKPMEEPEIGGFGKMTAKLPGLKKVWDRGYKGKGVGIVIIDSGVYPHPDFQKRLVAWVDFDKSSTTPNDSIGHGTISAGAALGDGHQSNGKYKGVAPLANLIAIRCSNNSKTVWPVIQAIQWAIDHRKEYNIKVINLSLGYPIRQPYAIDPLIQATELAVKSGIVVVASAGNYGGSETITSPANHPDVICVGAYDDNGTPSFSDDKVADFSSCGPTTFDDVSKPDLLAPGVNIVAPLAPGSQIETFPVEHIGKDYVITSGTSEATPLVAGLTAILLEANPELTPKQVQEILIKSSSPHLKATKYEQGAGLVQADKALELALRTKGLIKENLNTVTKLFAKNIQQVSKIGEQLQKHANLKNIQLSFQVEDNNIPNAYTDYKGNIHVTTALLTLLHEDGLLAFVLGHELGHLEQMNQQNTESKIIPDNSIPPKCKKEVMADLRGVELMMKLGYSPNEAIKAIELLNQALPSPNPELYPPANKRIRIIQSYFPIQANSLIN